nr:L-serine ammonia-lyase, iron-sulfur-dependent, subunit alpha [uncultured Anaerotignum sp.]
MNFDFTSLLKNEIKPALGVTEVGAIALAAARAYAAAGGTLQGIRMVMNGGMYKNAFSCAIPGTEELGCEMAAALGALGGDWTLGLEVLKHITAQHVAQARALAIPIVIDVDETKESIYIYAEVETSEGVGVCRIEDFHANIVFVAKNDTVLFAAAEKKAEEKQQAFDFEAVTVADMVAYAKNAPLADLRCIKDMIDMNCALSAEGERGVGLQIWKTLAAFQSKGEVGKDMIYAAQRLTCSAMDARLAGLPFAAMSIVGSGSHGILCSLPVVSYGRFAGKAEEEILRAVALSGLVTIFSKHYTGRLSALCGCVLGGGSGAAAGIVLLMGGGAEEVSAAMNHMAANLTGMICDGGSTGCALKASAGVYAAYLSAMLAMEGIAIPRNFGVIGSSAEQTEKNLGRISDEGMAPMDSTIIDVMKQGK